MRGSPLRSNRARFFCLSQVGLSQGVQGKIGGTLWSRQDQCGTLGDQALRGTRTGDIPGRTEGSAFAAEVDEIGISPLGRGESATGAWSWSSGDIPRCPGCRSGSERSAVGSLGANGGAPVYLLTGDPRAMQRLEFRGECVSERPRMPSAANDFVLGREDASPTTHYALKSKSALRASTFKSKSIEAL